MRSLQALSVPAVAEPPFEKAMRLALEQAALAADEGRSPLGRSSSIPMATRWTPTTTVLAN